MKINNAEGARQPEHNLRLTGQQFQSGHNVRYWLLLLFMRGGRVRDVCSISGDERVPEDRGSEGRNARWSRTCRSHQYAAQGTHILIWNYNDSMLLHALELSLATPMTN